MKKENLFMATFVILLTLILVLLCVVPVFAQDEEPPEEIPQEVLDENATEEPGNSVPHDSSKDCINCENPPELIVYGCKDYPQAFNYLDPKDWEGWKIVDDGSCYCANFVFDEWGNVDSDTDVPCEKADNSAIKWMNWDEYFGELAEQYAVEAETPEFEIITDYPEPVDTILVEDAYFGEELSMGWIE